MPVSADLLRALAAEDSHALEHQLGCMTGLLQIFDRRYGSRRVSNAGSGQSQPTSACETPRHEHPRRGNACWIEDDASQRIEESAAREQHHRAYSDSSEIFTKSFEAPPEERSGHSEESVAGPPEVRKLKVVVPARVGAAASSDIRDIVRASFDRDLRGARERPRASVDGSHGRHQPESFLKNLPRSSSVDHGRDRMRLSRETAPAAADLPRSSSVGAAQMLADWKDGLRSPRLASREREALKQHADHPCKYQNPRDGTRFTVELQQGPRLSVSVDDRRGGHGNSPRPTSRFCELLPSTESDIKELLRGSQRVGHRYSVDGTRDAPRACTAPRLSVDGRECYAKETSSATLAPRKLKQENREFVRQSSGRASEEVRRTAPNVVARLMGLEELPSRPEDTDLLHEFMHSGGSVSPPPPPSPPDDYDYAHRSADSLQGQFSFTHQQPEDRVMEFVEEERRVEPQVDQPRKPPHGRRSLWHIFEAMQLKGLLNGSSKKKQAEAVRLHNLKVAEEMECEEVKKRSESLPSRLSSDHSGVDTPRVLSRERAMPEHKPELHLKSTTLEAEEELRVLVPPTMTRSMSSKLQATAAGAPVPPVSSNLGAGDASVKIISRRASKTVAYQTETVDEIPKEPLQGADSSCSHSMSSGVRQSRKERGAARMTKSFSDVPQSSSPRGSRAHTQDKPTRSCSPRGDSRSVEGMRLMDAGKMRRKQGVSVKDREETKVSFANLRANATKQEFLKGRASGDPDTPRLLRRSSSESKLLAKIAEKPIVVDTPGTKPPVVGGRSAAPNVTLVRSKRPVSKDINKYPLKSRPASLLRVAKPTSSKATVAVDHVETVCTDVSESASTVAQKQQPAEAEPPAMEVRAIQGGALDQSGDGKHADARDQRTEPKAREKTIEIDEGVKTPRGVSIKKIDFSEDAQAEVAEQPSPVSVLDNSHFDEEELTPSPKAAKSSVVCLQEQSRNENDRRWSSARFLDLDLEENATPSTALSTVPESVKESAVDTEVPTPEKSQPALEVEDSTHRHSRCVCLKDADEEKAYVEELMEASSLGRGCISSDLLNLSSDYVIDPSIFDHLEAKRSHLDDDEKEALDRRILFDCVNEVLERMLETEASFVRWTGLVQPSVRKRPLGPQLVKQVLVEVEGIPCAASDDVCDTVYVILQKDLAGGRGRQWSDYSKELEEVGVAVERMIVKDLIEETVRELSALCGQNPLAAAGASRRQLFA